MNEYVAGLDLGLMNDYSALCILEVKPSGIMHLRHIQRFKLGTKYQTVCTQVDRLLGKLPGNHTLVVDQTGVGRGVTSMFDEREIPFVPVTITSGNDATQVNGEWRVPKRDLVAGLTVALQNGKLKVAKDLPATNQLVTEMLNFKIKISTAGNDSYGAWRESIHDDLVLSSALAVWYAPKAVPGEMQELVSGGHIRVGGEYESPDYQHWGVADYEDASRSRR